MAIHVFGCYYGLAVNFILARYVRPTIRPERNYYSNLMGLVGTMFLWLFWPLFNFGVYA
jgi:ammonium transporter Rh